MISAEIRFLLLRASCYLVVWQPGWLQGHAFPSVRALRHWSEQNSFPGVTEHLHTGWAHFFSVTTTSSEGYNLLLVLTSVR